MSSSPSVLSETLRSITLTKIRELEKQREAYNVSKDEILNTAGKDSRNVRKRVRPLLDGVKDLPSSKKGRKMQELFNIRYWLDQAEYDPSIPEGRLLTFEKRLRSSLEKDVRKLDLAHLYSRLLTEWIERSSSSNPELEDLERSDSDMSFDVVEDRQKARLEQLRDKFAQVVFEPLETDEVEINDYLQNLFAGDHGVRALENLRTSVSRAGKSLLEHTVIFDEQSLKFSIQALLRSDLVNEEKKASLNDFLKDKAVSSEIVDVLNMRFRDLKNWQWNLGDEGMPVVPRQSLNGKWRVVVDDDVLQALFTHWIGTRWAVAVKNILIGTRYSARLWKQYTRLPEEERKRRDYYFEHNHNSNLEQNVAKARQEIYQNDFFMSSLPSNFFEQSGGYDDDEDEEDEEDNDDRKKAKNAKKSPQDIRQLLLRTLATEVLMHRTLEGEVAVVQSDFQWFATGIAHSTIFAVMRFVGFQEEWITFIKKVLEPPLNMLDGSPVRIRKRGLPMAHILEKLLGELVLYFMDLAVAQNDGMILYRFHDDLWLVGKPDQCASSWKTMERFAKVMGLEFNKSKTGSVYLTDGQHTRDPRILRALPEGPVFINFLALDPESGTWVINKEHVQQHTEQLQKQLANSESVLEYIKTWNSCIGRFFSYTFGQPAHCFGIKHVSAILRTQRDIQKYLFNDQETGNTVAEHIKHMLKSRFNVDDIPDSFIYMPESLGGLCLKNPFISFQLLRRNICKDPEDYMRQFLEREREKYDNAKKKFDSLSEREKRKKYKSAFSDEDGDDELDPSLSWQEAQKFISFDKYAKYREYASLDLCRTYTYLLDQPKKDNISKTERLESALKALGRIPEGLDISCADGTDAELLWTVQYFEDELFEEFGGVEVVDTSLLPLGVMKVLRQRKVTWQMVL